MTPLEIAERLFDAITAGDIDTVQSLYAEDAVIWHNYDQVEQSPDQNLRVLRWLTRNVTNLRYDDVTRFPIEDGFVQQHVLRADTKDGKDIEVPACVVVRVAGDRVTRLDEYLDSAQVANLQ